jgi:hypothetical protein
MLWLINAHDRLLGFARIAKNLSLILKPLREVIDREDSDNLAMFRGWPQLLDWLVDNEVEPGPSSRDHGVALEKDPIDREGILRHPMYDCLWHRAKDNSAASTFRSLQWQVLWAHASFLFKKCKHDSSAGRLEYEAYSENPEWGVFPDSSYSATHSVRLIGQNTWPSYLADLEPTTPPWKFVYSIRYVRCSKEEEKRLRDLYLFLARVYGEEPWSSPVSRSRNSSSFRTNRRLSSEIAVPDDEYDSDSRRPTERWVTVLDLASDLTQEQILDLDISPEELGDTHDVYLAEQEGPALDFRQMAVTSAIAARGQLRHLQMSHQLLPWQYSQLTIQEVGNLLRRCNEAYEAIRDLATWDQSQFRTAELLCLIHTMLWTSSTPDRAWNLRVFTGIVSPDLKTQLSREGVLLFELNERHWHVPALLPPYESTIEDTEKQAHSLEEFFSLPDIAGTGTLLQELLNRVQSRWPSPEPGAQPLSRQEGDAQGSSRVDGRYLFAGEFEEYKSDLNAWLNADGSTTRVTAGRIGSFLFGRILANSGDIMAAVLTTGRDHPLARTQKFYSTYEIEELQRRYTTAAKTAFEQAGCTANPTPPAQAGKICEVQKGYVGARLCATKDAVELAIKRLKEGIQKTLPIMDLSGAIAFHNLFTLHTVMLFGYGTSMRAIRTPYLGLEQVDPDTSFVLISDKDDDSHNKTRLAWVPKIVADQMRCYADHCSAVASDNLELRNWPDPCFFLEPNGSPASVRPKSITDNMRPFLALPPNAHRRFMRRELLCAGCPPEMVNVWMGHAFQGEEPWGPHSSFSFAEYRSVLGPKLEKILEDLGWEVLVSPLV